MREMTVSQASEGFLEVIAAVERGETIIVTKNGKPVAKIGPQSADRTTDPEWQEVLSTLRESLRRKKPMGYRVVTISENEKYDDNV